MSNVQQRLAMRNRTGPQRTKVDENANSRHVRQSSVTGAARGPYAAANALKHGVQRAALGEVTTTAVNRRDTASKIVPAKGKEVSETVKRSSLTRASLFPNKAQAATATSQVNVQSRTTIARAPRPQPIRTSRVPVPAAPVIVEDEDDRMDVEETRPQPPMHASSQEVEAMIDAIDEEIVVEELAGDKPPRQWPEVSTERAERYKRELEKLRELYGTSVAEEESMVPEYAEEILEYMSELEVDCLPNPKYMEEIQCDITWQLRRDCINWMLQVHCRYHLLPETLWIAVNVLDRFLSKRTVSMEKLQMVGAISLFIAAKYEEILAPSIDEFVHICDGAYSRDHFLKGERIVLGAVDFKISHYCSPYTWLRKISQVDGYEVDTRTVAKYLIEATLFDERFIGVKPSMIAAIGMYGAQRMSGNPWNHAFVHYSGYTEEHLRPGYVYLLQLLSNPGFRHTNVFRKYAREKLLRTSLQVLYFTEKYGEQETNMDGLVLEG